MQPGRRAFGQERLDNFAAVNGRAIPDNYQLFVGLLQQGLQEADNALAVKGRVAGLQEQLPFGTDGAKK